MRFKLPCNEILYLKFPRKTTSWPKMVPLSGIEHWEENKQDPSVYSLHICLFKGLPTP